MLLIVAIIIIVQALAHIYYFISEEFFSQVKQISLQKVKFFPKRLAKLAGKAWLVAGIIFLLASVSLVFGDRWWKILAFFGVIFSQTLVVFYWRSTWASTIANIIILAAIFG